MLLRGTSYQAALASLSYWCVPCVCSCGLGSCTVNSLHQHQEFQTNPLALTRFSASSTTRPLRSQCPRLEIHCTSPSLLVSQIPLGSDQVGLLHWSPPFSLRCTSLHFCILHSAHLFPLLHSPRPSILWSSPTLSCILLSIVLDLPFFGPPPHYLASSYPLF